MRKRRKIQRNTARKKQIATERSKLWKLPLLCIGGVLILLFFCDLTLKFFQLSTISIPSLGGEAINWNQNADLNVFVGYLRQDNTFDHMAIVSLDQNAVRIVPIPNTLSVISDSGTSVQLNTLYAISALQNKQNAWQTFQRYLQSNFDVSVPGYFLIRADKQHEASLLVDLADFSKLYAVSADFGWIFSHTSQLHSLLGQDFATNISIYSLSSVAGFLNSGVGEQVLSIAPGDLLHRTGVTLVDTQNFSADTGAKLTDAYVDAEHARISIYNGSGIPGEANLATSLLQAQGGIVDFTGEALASASNTVIYCQNPGNFPSTIAALQQAFHAKVVQQSYASNTSDISLVLGKDIHTWYSIPAVGK